MFALTNTSFEYVDEKHVNNAPIGAAKLNTIRWFRAPSLGHMEANAEVSRSGLVNKATKTMKPNLSSRST